ncbi:PAS domain-containing sensor histidine kinase [Bartonella rattimassiliensis]|uniref:histidine kinase n=1 Tax=Bartonella rattimassiliensis 15908 TaxID=1094556 RepID=J0ZD83_9HYPH|nr:HAMP domain-containing sensor histidine kinase [Bartonella rattimassiliensis]EJF85913.1 PAS domain S-box protein [Bartonella rattimassiliensis 15908]
MSLKADELKLNTNEVKCKQETFRFTPGFLPRPFTWEIDKNGLFCEVSKELAEVVGPLSSSILGCSFYELAHRFNDERYRILSRFIEAAMPWNKEIVQWPVDGCSQWLDVELTALPIFDVKKKLKGFYGFGVLKIREKAHEKSDEKLEMEMPCLSEIERSAFREIAEQLRDELNLSVKEELSTSAKEENFVEETAIQLSYAQTMSVNAIEQALIKEPAAVLSLLDTATDGVLWLDEQGFIQSVSKAALALIGYEINELQGQAFSALFTLRSRFLVEKYFKLIRMKGENQVLNRNETADLITKNHKNITVLITIVFLAQQGNYAVMLRDITETVLSETKKTEEDKIAEVVHEIRTPLNALIGFAEIMKEGRFGSIENERYHGYLRDIISSGKHILSLINQLLECSKINYSGSNNQIASSFIAETFDVISCLRATIAFLEAQANHNGIIMRIVAPPHVPFIAISQQIFRQIIWNLLSNAIRFTPLGGQIIVHVSYRKERVKISVSDNGIGMSEEEIVQALQPYGQIERKDGRSGDSAFIGTGLGLPMCKAMVEESGGQFLLFSKPDHGTTVEMFFPHVP